MNKQDWTYKKLGEVCEIYQPKTLSSNMLLPDGKYAVYGANGIIGRYDKYNHESSEVLMTCRGATCGTINVSEPFSWINGNAMVIHPQSDELNKAYLVYVLKGIDLSNVITGAAQPQITRQSLSPTKIPIPPIAEQERIVAELDLLSDIIEKKKEQLKAYDQLAQSIFYTMFGDPIDNPKGWEVKTMSDVCASMTKGPFGSDIKKSLFVPKSKETYKVYIQANAIEKDISLGDYYISKDYFDNKMFRFEVKPNDYIITCDGTLGKYIRLPQCIERGIISASLLRLTLNDNINYRYFEHLWDYYILHQQIKDIRNTALKHLPSASKMGKTTIPLPPISLQEEFAEKVEAIERQKALVQQSIDETQTMFDYTMDKYFG